jgi:hypothetical protein
MIIGNCEHCYKKKQLFLWATHVWNDGPDDYNFEICLDCISEDVAIPKEELMLWDQFADYSISVDTLLEEPFVGGTVSAYFNTERPTRGMK